MENIEDDKTRRRHLRITAPSPWLMRFAHLIQPAGRVLDLAAGGGRNGRHLLGLGHPVTFIDKDTSSLTDLSDDKAVEIHALDLEDGKDVFSHGGVLAGRTFQAIVVINYLHRPLMGALLSALAPGGVLIYETFARGNEAFVRPRNPDHLLKSGELLDWVSAKLQVVAYEHGIIRAADIEGVKQRLCAIKDLSPSTRDDGEPVAYSLDAGK